MAAFWAQRQNFRGIEIKRVVAFFADEMSQPDHFPAVINAMMADVFENLTPFELSFVGNIGEFLP